MTYKICKHNVPADECSQCFNERQIPVDAYLRALNSMSSTTGERERLFNADAVDAAAEKGIRKPQRDTPEPYLSGYRAGWNDALVELLRKVPYGFTYADLKETINSLKRDNED